MVELAVFVAVDLVAGLVAPVTTTDPRLAVFVNEFAVVNSVVEGSDCS